MKSILIQLTMIVSAIGFSSVGFASDLSNDLKTPFEPLTNPFENVAEVELQASLANPLKDLLQKCAYVNVKTSEGGGRIFGDTRLKTECLSVLKPNYTVDQGQSYINNKLVVLLNGAQYLFVSWDGSDSDGGDQQAIGVYDSKGNRIAVYPSLYVDGNVVDGVLHALGLVPTEVQQ